MSYDMFICLTQVRAKILKTYYTICKMINDWVDGLGEYPVDMYVWKADAKRRRYNSSCSRHGPRTGGFCETPALKVPK